MRINEPDAPPSGSALDSTVDYLRKFNETAQAILETGSQQDFCARLQDTVQHALPALNALKAYRPLLLQQIHYLGCVGALPHDVLAEVFRAWAFLPDGDGRNHRACVIPPSYAAASVNRHWRAVALATPTIWTRSILNFEKQHGLVDYIETTLLRSGACPLHVDIINANDARWHRVPDSLLVGLMSRCGRLSMAWDIGKKEPSFGWSMLQTLQMSMALLEHLELAGLRETQNVPDHTHLLTLSPRLKTLDVERLRFSLLQPALIPRLERFTTMSRMRGTDLAALVRGCPLLTELQIFFFEDGVPVSIPKLSILACNDASEIFSSILSADHAPMLRELRIGSSPEVLEGLESFLTSGPCTSMTTLDIAHRKCRAHFPDGPSSDDDDQPWKFLAVLPKLPNVSVLRLRNLCCAELARVFDAWQHDARVASKLRALELHDCSMDDDTTQLLASFLAARKNAGIPIDDVGIVQRGLQPSTWGIFSTWLQPRLEQLITGVVSVDVATAEVTPYDF
ncbi:hypothetical protein AURDEDRAFT_188884 [Auricularia subglabra TFB-10046 SS5]|uniref:F-box domain-containing protein n=1 Tax=Auricularia subglabra (strain TFB-10046 / SS5) TaxID=717982 RepID=J0D7D2_AURST|nr:hypothetical protein AURDEDRAFT_188884 [Auricularia subglabra TFB-10046 SS5]